MTLGDPLPFTQEVAGREGVGVRGTGLGRGEAEGQISAQTVGCMAAMMK